MSCYTFLRNVCSVPGCILPKEAAVIGNMLLYTCLLNCHYLSKVCMFSSDPIIALTWLYLIRYYAEKSLVGYIYIKIN